MTITPNQLKLFWVAVRKLDWNDADVRVALVEIAGVTSSKELNADGFKAMMGFFEYSGFRPARSKGEDYGPRPGMASFAQLELIRTLWVEWTKGEGDEDSLTVWLARHWGVSSLRFVTGPQAAKMITALKAMKSRRAA